MSMAKIMKLSNVRCIDYAMRLNFIILLCLKYFAYFCTSFVLRNY